MNDATNSRRRGARGFTLLELLLVVGVIALLSSVLFAVMTSVGVGRKKLLALKQVTDIAEAARHYYREHNVYPPDTDVYEPGDPTPQGLSGDAQKYAIMRYLGTKLLDPKTGATWGPYMDVQERYLKGDSVMVDGKEVQLIVDPWGNPYEMDCMHVPIDLATKVIGKPVFPYADGVPKEEQLIEVKVWSKGPDGKSTLQAPFFPDGSATDDEDNIMSWATLQQKKTQ